MEYFWDLGLDTVSRTVRLNTVSYGEMTGMHAFQW